MSEKLITVTITKELEDFWGISELLAQMPNTTKDQKELAIMHLLLEDWPALIDYADWSFDGIDEAGEA